MSCLLPITYDNYRTMDVDFCLNIKNIIKIESKLCSKSYGILKKESAVEIQAIGAGAVNQAIKSVT